MNARGGKCTESWNPNTSQQSTPAGSGCSNQSRSLTQPRRASARLSPCLFRSGPKDGSRSSLLKRLRWKSVGQFALRKTWKTCHCSRNNNKRMAPVVSRSLEPESPDAWDEWAMIGCNPIQHGLKPQAWKARVTLKYQQRYRVAVWSRLSNWGSGMPRELSGDLLSDRSSTKHP